MDYKEKIEISRVLRMSNTEVAEWLKANTKLDPNIEIHWWDLESHHAWRKPLEFLLARRQDPMIDFALAQYGVYVPTLRRLFRRQDKALQLAVLTNQYVGPSDDVLAKMQKHPKETGVLSPNDLLKMIKDLPATQDHLEAYYGNPQISRENLHLLIKREELFSSIDDLTIAYILYYLRNNPILSRDRDDTMLDGYADYSYSKLFHDFWSLFLQLPKEQAYAKILSDVAERLLIPSTSTDVLWKILDEWNLEDEDNDEYSPSPSVNLRSTVAWRLVVPGLFADEERERYREHEDQAVRLGFYKGCKPGDLFGHLVRNEGFEYPESFDDVEYLNDTQISVVEVCRQCFKKDGNRFIHALIENEYFWHRKEERHLLDRLAWELAEDEHHSMMVPSEYRSTHKFYRNKHPQFFDDDEDLGSVNEEDKQSLRKQRLLIREINATGESISTKVDEKFQELHEKLLDATQRQVQLGGYIGWVGVIVVVIVIVIVLKVW